MRNPNDVKLDEMMAVVRAKQQEILDIIDGMPSGGDMLKATYDTDNDGKVNAAVTADTATSATNATNAANADALGGVAAALYATKTYADAAGIVAQNPTLAAQTTDYAVPASYSLIVSGKYAIGSGSKLTINSGAKLTII